MSDFVSFSPQDVEKIGVICQACNSEVVIDLKPEVEGATPVTLWQPSSCPACKTSQPPFSYAQERGEQFTWLAEAQRLKRLNAGDKVRFYFKSK